MSSQTNDLVTFKSLPKAIQNKSLSLQYEALLVLLDPLLLEREKELDRKWERKWKEVGFEKGSDAQLDTILERWIETEKTNTDQMDQTHQLLLWAKEAYVLLREITFVSCNVSCPYGQSEQQILYVKFSLLSAEHRQRRIQIIEHLINSSPFTAAEKKERLASFQKAKLQSSWNRDDTFLDDWMKEFFIGLITLFNPLFDSLKEKTRAMTNEQENELERIHSPRSLRALLLASKQRLFDIDGRLYGEPSLKI